MSCLTGIIPQTIKEVAMPTVVGQRVPKIEGAEKVTGHTPYTADVQLPGLLWGKVLRSPHAHARIVSIDASAAKSVPGVLAVITAQDIPYVLAGRRLKD